MVLTCSVLPNESRKSWKWYTYEVLSKGRQERKVKVRSLFCFWTSRELGISHTELAKRLEVSSASIGYSAERGEAIAKEGGYFLMK